MAGDGGPQQHRFVDEPGGEPDAVAGERVPTVAPDAGVRRPNELQAAARRLVSRCGDD
jgi:hypothetical protein